jgi:AcrR family transcriptional regulator
MPKVTDEHLAAKRELILHAAIACFARDGFHKTTMSDIAEMAGVSDGLAYRYFAGKDEIIREAVRFATGNGLVSDLEAADDDPAAMIELLYKASFRRFEMPDRRTTVGLRLRSWAEALENEEVREQVVERWERYRPIAEGLWSKARAEGLLPPDLDPDAVERVMFAIHDGLDLQWALDPTLDIEKCREVVLAMFRGWFSAGRDGSSARAEGGDDEP